MECLGGSGTLDEPAISAGGDATPLLERPSETRARKWGKAKLEISMTA